MICVILIKTYTKDVIMAIYLIDYENTKNLSGISDLSADDCVVIFYSNKANSLSFDVHKEILSSKARIEYKFVDVGCQNALDFQLSSYLGYIVKQNENTECKICIVSKDKGFSYVSSFWEKEKAINIQILCDLTGKESTSTIEIPKLNCDIESILRESEIQLSDSEITQILAMVKKYKTTKTINDNFNKLFKDSTKAGTILKLIKPFIKK